MISETNDFLEDALDTLAKHHKPYVVLTFHDNGIVVHTNLGRESVPNLLETRESGAWHTVMDGIIKCAMEPPGASGKPTNDT